MRRWFSFWHRVTKATPKRSRTYRPLAEGLEDRRLLAAPVIEAISNQTVPFGKSLFVPVAGGDADGDALTYTVSSSNAQVTARVRPRSTFLRITVANFGDMVFQLFNDLTPRTVETISGFVKSKFYDSLTFHRIVKDFSPQGSIIQGGDPRGDGSGDPGFKYEDEFVASSLFTGTGQLAMANSGKDTNGSQFFVTVGPQRFLDQKHTIFGQLVRGFDVLTRLANVSVDSNSKPTTPVVITRAALFTNTTDAVLTVTAGTGAGAATITVTADDGKGGTTSQTFQVTPQADTNNSPAILGPIANQLTPVNTAATFDLSGTDAENDPLEFTATLQDSQPRSTLTVNGNRVTITPNTGFTGVIRVLVGVKQRGTDALDTQEITVTVGDQAFTVTGVTVTGTEGTAVRGVNVATFTSTNGSATAADFTARINWGDAQISDGAITKTGSTFTVTGGNTFKFGGRYPVRVTVTSKLGHRVFADTTATIADATLAGEPITNLSARQNMALNNVTVAGFTDANPNSILSHFTAVIDWGDSQTSAGTIAAKTGGGGFNVQGSHTYTTTGARTVRVTISQVASTDDVAFGNAVVNSALTVKELPTNQRIVTQVYRDVLEREADAAGLAFWVGKLEQGSTRDQLLVDMQSTTEYRKLVVNKFYRKLLNRAAEQAALDFYLVAFSIGGIQEQVQANIIASQEYFTVRGGSANASFVDQVFRDVLGRTADDASRNSFVQRLLDGASRRQVVDQIFASGEFRQVAVRNYFQLLLRRVTDNNGLEYFTNVALARGARQEQVVAGICGSDEYLDNVKS